MSYSSSLWSLTDKELRQPKASNTKHFSGYRYQHKRGDVRQNGTYRIP